MVRRSTGVHYGACSADSPPAAGGRRVRCQASSGLLGLGRRGALDISIWTDMRLAPGRMPTAEHYDQMVDLVKLAESLGYHGVWTSEQHGVDDGYLPSQLPLLAALARETSRLRLATGVLLLPLAQWRRVAEEACTVDLLSHGRLTLGVGLGHYPHEFRVFGVQREKRADLLEHALRFIRPGLAGRLLPDGLPVGLVPEQQHIPLLVAGLAGKAVDRAVRLGDGHFGYSFEDPVATYSELWKQHIEPSLQRHGRSCEDFRLVAGTMIWVSDSPEKDWHSFVGPAFVYQQQRYADWCADLPSAAGYNYGSDLKAMLPHVLVGRPAEIRDRLRDLATQVPLHELVFWARLPGVPHERASEHLRRFAEEVMPALSGP